MSEKKREGFIFYRSFALAAETLKKSEKLLFYEHIIKYALNGEEPDPDHRASYSMFLLVKPQLDANFRRYENGVKGGRPKKPNGNQTETETKPNDNQTETETKPKEKEKEKEKAKEKEKEKAKAKDEEKDKAKAKETLSGGSAGWPSLGEVTAYGHEAGVPALAAKFWQENNRRKWQINGEPIRNWKKLFDSWARTEREASAGVRSGIDWNAVADEVAVGKKIGTTFSEPFVDDDGVEYVTEVAEG